MKKILLTLAIAISSYCSFAQTNTFPSSGNVGIGTTSPDLALNLYGIGDVGLAVESSINAPYLGFRKAGVDKWLLVLERNTPAYGMSANDIGFLKAGASIPSFMIQQSTGNVGIGTTSPVVKLDVNGSINIRSNDNLTWGGAYGAGIPTIAANNSVGIIFYPTGSTSGESMRINSGGNVAIGTTDPHGYKLAVDGSVIATSVTVKLYADWPDYVFKKEYQLPSLLEVKTYIDKNQHLPDMPSEQDVAKNGLNLGEIAKLQTKKIEELTLYLIDKDKQVNNLQNEVNQLKQQQISYQLQQEQISWLKEQLTTLTKALTKN